jgi:prepilin-type N-terminal cleavage/methylation domain-containing protein
MPRLSLVSLRRPALRPRPATSRARLLASEDGFTLLELVIVATILTILLLIPISSYLSYRTKANDATARANVHVVIPSIEAYWSDNGTYVGMTTANLKSSYDAAIDPARYTLLSLSVADDCVSSASGDKSWMKDGPDGAVTSGSCS